MENGPDWAGSEERTLLCHSRCWCLAVHACKATFDSQPSQTLPGVSGLGSSRHWTIPLTDLKEPYDAAGRQGSATHQALSMRSMDLMTDVLNDLVYGNAHLSKLAMLADQANCGLVTEGSGTYDLVEKTSY